MALATAQKNHTIAGIARAKLQRTTFTAKTLAKIAGVQLMHARIASITTQASTITVANRARTVWWKKKLRISVIFLSHLRVAPAQEPNQQAI